MPSPSMHLRRLGLGLGLILATTAWPGTVADAAVLVGTPQSDTFRTGASNDAVWGNGGDDELLDQGGRDYLSAGAGDDSVLGDQRDLIYGGPGDDVIVLVSAKGLAFRVNCGTDDDTLLVQDAGGEPQELILARAAECEHITVSGDAGSDPGGLTPTPPDPDPAGPVEPAPEPTPAPAPTPGPGFPARDDIGDAFERAELGAAWRVPAYTAAPATPLTDAGAVQMPSDTWGSAYYAAMRFGAAQEIRARKVRPGMVGVGACLDRPAEGGAGYSLELDAAGAMWLWRYADGEGTELFRRFDGAGTVGVGDGLGLRVAGGKVEAWIRPQGGAWKLARTVDDPAARTCSGHLTISGYEGALDDVAGGGSDPVAVTSAPAPAPAPVPAPPGFRLGVHTGARDFDLRATEVLRPGLVRVGGLDAGTPRAKIAEIAEAYAARGAKIIALVDFNDRAPDLAQARNVGTWATVPNVAAIEYGNEPWLNAGWDYRQYAASFQVANDAVISANPGMTLIAVADSANRAHRPGLQVLRALKDAGTRPRAVQFHPYGPGYAARLGDLQRDLADVGWTATEIWATEVGVATDDGRTLYQGDAPNNYGWNAAMSYVEAARTVERIVTDLRASGVAAVLLYMGTDYRAPGTSNEREHYFGLTTDANREKGALTAKARELLARYR